MSRLVLHIGPHKTGSTYIQKFLSENSEQLEELGVHYPKLGLGGQYGHHELVEKIRSLDESALAQYLGGYLGAGTNLLSSENFDRLKADDLARFRAALLPQLTEPAQIQILFYHRNYADLLPSWWQEEIKHGGVFSFYEFMLPHLLRPFASNLVNPALVLDLYAQAFGKDSISVIDYDSARDELLVPLFSLAGIEMDPGANEVVNSSMKVELVEVLRVLNSIAKSRNEWHFHRTRALFLQKLRDAPVAAELEELTEHIRAHMKPVRIAGGFFEKAVSAAFRTKYEARFFNQPSETPPERELLVASDTWLLQGTPSCERIYQYLIEGGGA
jgi:hypothetical protein